jgi:hypothetical protein
MFFIFWYSVERNQAANVRKTDSPRPSLPSADGKEGDSLGKIYDIIS